MDEKVTKKYHVFALIMIILFVSFMAMYLSQATGYYAFEQRKKMTFTEQQIRKFEKDVAEGKNIDINNYLYNTNKDYQTKTASLGLKISSMVAKVTRSSIEKTFKLLGRLVE